MLIATIVGSKALSTGDLAAASASVGACGPVRWLEEGRAAEFHLQSTERNEASLALEQALPHADVFVQPVAERGKKLFVADMDSTMIDAECIDELADYANLKAEISAVTEAAMRGEIDFAGALTRRVALLKGLSETAIAACLRDRVRPTPGAKTLVATLKAQGIRTVLVSGGFTHFTGPVAADIGFDMAVANTLELAGNTLTGRVAPPIVGPETKAATLRSEAARIGARPSETLAVGDGANDIQMLGEAGFGVAYRAKPRVAAMADARIRVGDLTALLHALGIPRHEWIDGLN